MTKFLLPILALGAVAAPAVAAPADQPIAFERDGIRYVATVKTVGETTVIEGRELDSGKTFSLRARNGYVQGTYGANPVSYTVNR